MNHKFENPMIALKEWAIENELCPSIKECVGLPSDENTYLNITKLILPLGGGYKKPLPNELSYLVNLEYLIIMAMNATDIPRGIFYLLNLETISISVNGYVINDDDLRILMNNGCKHIYINNIYRDIDNTNVIRDRRVINYLENNQLFVTSKDYGISYDDLYIIAKQIAFEDIIMAEYMIDLLPGLNYKDGFKAYICANNRDEKGIDNIINFPELDFYISDDPEDHREYLLEIGLSIAENYPYKALELYYIIDNTYEVVGNAPERIEDLAQEIVLEIANSNIDKALKLLDNIVEDDYYKIEVLEKIYSKLNNKQVLSRLLEVKEKIKEYD